MKTLIIYFSQTGNTEKIANAINTGVKEVTGHCDIVKIRDANPKRLYEYDLLGLGCPVYGGGEPGNVTAFIKDMWSVGGKHIFVFYSHNTMPYRFLSSIVPKLKGKGLTVIGMQGWYAGNYQQGHPSPYPTDGHLDEIDVRGANNFGREMVGRSHRISAGETNLIPPPPEIPDYYGKVAPRPQASSHASQWSDRAKLNMEKCIYPECRLCMDNCPMYGIDLSVRPPVWAKPCINCAFCELICPTGAIEVDWETSVAGTQKMLKGFSLPHLAEAERLGHFRRLVPVEDIGWDTPFYKFHNKHPRWIIGKGPQ